MPVLITNCSNNYGPYHFPEKLIPKTILNALNQVEIPVYGNGKQVRDWLYVEDHVNALYTILKDGKLGETYNIGGQDILKNIDVPLCLWDERLSSVGAFNLSNQLDINVSKKIKNLDKNAAAFILQGAIDYLKN